MNDVRADADEVEIMKFLGKGSPLSTKPALIAAAMRAVAANKDYDAGGVYRQRRLLTVIIEHLPTAQADKLKDALLALRLPTVASIGQLHIGNNSSITITLKPPPQETPVA
jgi:hypothetical protein